MMKGNLFLGVDGGQSHTEAIIADAAGNILGRGTAGPSNHAEQPGGRERLRNAVFVSVRRAFDSYGCDLPVEQRFRAAHFGMTGGADYKDEIIGEIITADHLHVGHDAPTALCGATGAKPGVVVIAGAGSIVYGENELGDRIQIGGLGFLFSDEGSGFWLAAQAIRLAIKEKDGLIENDGLEELVVKFFKVSKIRDLTTAFYNDKVSRDEIAALAKVVHDAAENGNQTMRAQILYGADVLAESVACAANRLNLGHGFAVAGIGGMFRGALMSEFFATSLRTRMPSARFIKPIFGPAVGCLLLAYRAAGIELDETLLANLEKTQNR